jgi:hypothetical protein
LCCTAYQFSILNALANHLRQHFKESIRVVSFAAIESERLFIEIAKEMKRFDTDIRAADSPL